jgi:hypothetical protein
VNLKGKIIRQEAKSTLALPEFVRFRETATNLLFDCKLMNNGVIVRQCPPLDMNIAFYEFEEFEERFEISYAQS